MVRVPLVEGAATVMGMEAMGVRRERGTGCTTGAPLARGPMAPQLMRQERREISWAPGMSWPALRASLMEALSGLLVVVKLSH